MTTDLLRAGAPRPLLSRTAEARLGPRHHEILEQLESFFMERGFASFTIADLAAEVFEGDEHLDDDVVVTRAVVEFTAAARGDENVGQRGGSVVVRHVDGQVLHCFRRFVLQVFDQVYELVVGLQEDMRNALDPPRYSG